MEIIISIGVILTALVASVALISSSISSTRLSRSRITAQGLAQEGLEIVRNIRDNNWLIFKRKVTDWRDGLQAGDWRVQYSVNNLLSFASLPLKTNTSGFYQYDIGTDTLFYRKITLEYIGDNQIKATSEITWQEYGRNNSLKVETRLYNWLEEPEP